MHRRVEASPIDNLTGNIQRREVPYVLPVISRSSTSRPVPAQPVPGRAVRAVPQAHAAVPDTAVPAAVVRAAGADRRIFQTDRAIAATVVSPRLHPRPAGRARQVHRGMDNRRRVSDRVLLLCTAVLMFLLVASGLGLIASVL